MLVSRDAGGRDLQIGDPVTLYYGGIANRGYVGKNSRGKVAGFGRVNVQVHISESRSEDLIGATVPVPGCHLVYGHVGYVRTEDLLADTLREMEALEAEKRRRDQREYLHAVITLATERALVTRAQGHEIWQLRDEVQIP